MDLIEAAPTQEEQAVRTVYTSQTGWTPNMTVYFECSQSR